MNLLAGRLVLTAALFVGWLGYLVYLVATRPLTAANAPLVLSRPQIMTSRIDIIAEVTDPMSEVVIEQVLFQPSGPGEVRLEKGNKIEVLDLDQCHPQLRGEAAKPTRDFTGPGRYLIPIRASKRKIGAYEVVPIPTSPGFDPERGDARGVRLRIYPATSEAIEQHSQIEKPKAP